MIPLVVHIERKGLHKGHRTLEGQMHQGKIGLALVLLILDVGYFV